MPDDDTEIYIARVGFACTDVSHLGELAKDAELPVRVRPGDTVEEGHWLLALAPDNFEPLTIDHHQAPGSVRYPITRRRSVLRR
jgi:hypothetical protein